VDANQDEDCIAFSAANVRAVQSGSTWTVLDGSRPMLTMKNRADANKAVALIKKFNYRYQCVVGRPIVAGQGMSYFR
jgi:hypothetical protein